MTAEDYLYLFPCCTREKSRFMAVASAVLQQVVDLQAVVGELNAAFSPDSAQGAQLDALGESLGLSRLDTTAGIAATDEVYRDFIRKKLIRAVRTFAEAMIAYIGTGAVVLGDVNWLAALSAGGMGFVIAILLALAGLPEVEKTETEN